MNISFIPSNVKNFSALNNLSMIYEYFFHPKVLPTFSTEPESDVELGQQKSFFLFVLFLKVLSSLMHIFTIEPTKRLRKKLLSFIE